MGRARQWSIVAGAAALVCIVPNTSLGYSVLAHEAIIDALWVSEILPALHKRFPALREEDARDAHAYAYGGAIIQDMGYYPFGSKFYSDLTHYARSGDFIHALLTDANDANEYAFAIGALSHYAADNSGHPIATNAAVPLLYPKLRAKLGDTITYEEKPSAHIQTEFGFDVVQVARGHYVSQAYHDFIGFKVARDLLERAFQETYGIELAHLFRDFDLAIGTYRYAVSDVIPRMTRAAWQSMKSDLARGDSARVPRHSVRYVIPRGEYDKEFGTKYRTPGMFARFLAFLIRIVPKIGPFKMLAVKPPTPETEKLFVHGFDVIVDSYRGSLRQLRAGSLTLPNRNLDIGRPTKAGEYGLADAAYTRLVHEIANDKYAHVRPALRANVVAFFSDTTLRTPAHADAAAWQQTRTELGGLRSATLTAGSSRAPRR